uniref:Uncharacterized protein n=1 Tax=Globisporangium ultimum (strain ATCC 200006 / CBS 805.95 / DAOM BR144) TaxID=431595 RepID=K3X7W3_GLOUD
MLFSPLKQELEGREEAQRREQEKQSRLMKKRQDQQAQDTLRLQQSRRESAMLITTNAVSVEKSASPNAAELANFRLRRMARESCQELQNELQYGVTVHGECQTAGNAQYFFLKYNPNVDGSILTLKLCVERGEAEVFMSTATKVPCVSDFMWRSVETSKGLDEGDGQKLVLYPHQLAKVISIASTEGPRADKSDTKESNQAIPFYISVLAVEAGQKIEPSHAIQTVNHLIARFNQLTKSACNCKLSKSRGIEDSRAAVPTIEARYGGRNNGE